MTEEHDFLASCTTKIDRNLKPILPPSCRGLELQPGSDAGGNGIHNGQSQPKARGITGGPDKPASNEPASKELGPAILKQGMFGGGRLLGGLEFCNGFSPVQAVDRLGNKGGNIEKPHLFQCRPW